MSHRFHVKKVGAVGLLNLLDVLIELYHARSPP